MRTYGALSPINQVPQIPDTFGSIIISSAYAIVTNDWPTGAQLVAFSGQMNFGVNWLSTAAGWPSTNSSGTTMSSGSFEINPGLRQISTGLSTGYSLTAPTSGVITANFWKK